MRPTDWGLPVYVLALGLAFWALVIPVWAANPQGLTAGVSFSCLWWSESQMEGMNPNNPPPKSTEVVLTKWEYSDPVGVPHPDVVNAIITVKNASAELFPNLEVQVLARWLVGQLRHEGDSTWSDSVLLRQFRNISVKAGESTNLRVPVDLKAKMSTLEKRGAWPYSLRILVSVRSPDRAATLTNSEADLPIKPGD